MISNDIKSFDWLHKRDELVRLFTNAGLTELANLSKKGTASCSDIERVLVELIIHRRVPYLPFVPTPGLDQDLLYTGTKPPAGEKKNLQKFIDSLPADVVLHRVVSHPGSSDFVPGLIAIVVCDTTLTQLEAAFTLIPVPRPLDAAEFLTS